MSKDTDVISQIKTQLQASDYLNCVSDNQIFLGAREKMTIFPCIVIEPLRISESQGEDANTTADLYFTVAIIGYIQAHDKDKQIVGNTTVRGIVDLLTDIKKALSADLTLSGKVITLTMSEGNYDIPDEYPTRSVAIEVTMQYRQGLTTRT